MKQHSPKFLSIVNASKARIDEITAQQLKDKIDKGEIFSLIDVREESEWAQGHLPKATHMGKGIIERDIEKKHPDTSMPIIVYCSGGFRCALVADSLQQMGYTNVRSLGCGMQGWIDAGFSIEL